MSLEIPKVICSNPVSNNSRNEVVKQSKNAIANLTSGLDKFIKENPQKLSLADKVKGLLTNIRIKASAVRESQMWSKVIKRIFK